jgi:3-dehydroquinate synthase
MLDAVFFAPEALAALRTAVARPATGRVAVLVDQHTARLCLPRVRSLLPADFVLIEIPAGEAHKTLETCQRVWTTLTAHHVGRDGLLVCLGGGVVTDLGGFVAATYLRGIRCALVPTTLLAMVDAAIGGKNGVDFDGLKNHLGTFRAPSDGVFIVPEFLDTLEPTDLVSGYAEVVKHWLISGTDDAFRAGCRTGLASADWPAVIADAVATKARIVAADPLETGPRRLLNFGHTIGHALETWALRAGQPVPHGYAVAAGMLAETWLSHERGLLSEADFDEITVLLASTFPKLTVAPDDIPAIAALTLHDKKNTQGTVRCVLLTGIGTAEIDHPVRLSEIAAALRWYQTTVR